MGTPQETLISLHASLAQLPVFMICTILVLLEERSVWLTQRTQQRLVNSTLSISHATQTLMTIVTMRVTRSICWKHCLLMLTRSPTLGKQTGHQANSIWNTSRTLSSIIFAIMIVL